MTDLFASETSAAPNVAGHLSKMAGTLDAQSSEVSYHLRAGEQRLALNERIGTPLRLRFEGHIACTHCGRKTNKSFAQGYCYPCFKRLAQCDTCIMKPETCHYFQGTCREPEWGEAHCFTPHIVYLANSSGLKVGITRKTNMPTRWIDQGAIQALPIMEVASRQQSGFVETLFKEHVSDRTNWRAMLKGEVEPLDLIQERDRLLETVASGLDALRETYGQEAIRVLDDTPLDIRYPVEVFPRKIASHNFDKQPVVEGVLNGVKGQYLIFDTGVINLRKFTGYRVSVDSPG